MPRLGRHAPVHRRGRSLAYLQSAGLVAYCSRRRAGAAARQWKTERLIMEPIVSIVMPTFNRMEFWPQRGSNRYFGKEVPVRELIIADDGSNAQTTVDYLDSLTRDERRWGYIGCSGPATLAPRETPVSRRPEHRVAGVSRLG